MPKKKKIKKKEKDPETKTEEVPETKKEKEESELEEQIEEQEPISPRRFQDLLQTKIRAPILETVTQEEPEITSLEKEIEITPTEKKESERKYDEAIKYDIESDYQESVKRQREITSDMTSQVTPVSLIDLETVGREREIPMQEFQMKTPVEMPKAPTSSEEYDIIKAKKSKKSIRDPSAFQKNLERRYEFD
jgi:hypothetical protein